MEFIQKKTADGAVEHFLEKAAEKGISLVWDRFEGQIPECGFCETGLSCRDCLQGPCISHPFKDSSKAGVCGKDKDTLAAQSLLRLVIKGTMAYLDRLSDLANGVESGKIRPKNREEANQIVSKAEALFKEGARGMKREFPKSLVDRWEKAGVLPEGISRDLFKASQKLEGGMADNQEILLWAFKASLLACLAQRLEGGLERSVFGEVAPTTVEVNLGVLSSQIPHLLLYGHLSPLLKRKIAEEAAKKNVGVMGVCTEVLLPPHIFSPVTNYGSQEIPLMTGAVDLIVAGDQFVNPSLASVAHEWEVPVISADGLKDEKDLAGHARQIVEKAKKSFGFRHEIPKDIPDTKESARMGFSVEKIDVKRIVTSIMKGTIRGIVILSGSGNVKFTQDREITTLAGEFLKNDILCISRGETSVSLAKYGFLNPSQREKRCGKGLLVLLSSLGDDVPSVLDFGKEGRITDFLLSVARVAKKDLKDLPIVACFVDANRSSEVAEAIWTVGMGVSTYFWPSLPVTGSPKTVEALSEFCREKFGAKLSLLAEKLEPQAKASRIMKHLKGEAELHLLGQPWKQG